MMLNSFLISAFLSSWLVSTVPPSPENLMTPAVVTVKEAQAAFGAQSSHSMVFEETTSSKKWGLDILFVGNPPLDEWLFERSPQFTGEKKQRKALALLYSDSQTFVLTGELYSKTLFLRYSNSELESSIIQAWLQRNDRIQFQFPKSLRKQNMTSSQLTSSQSLTDGFDFQGIQILGLPEALPSLREVSISPENPFKKVNHSSQSYSAVGQPNPRDDDLFWMEVTWTRKGETIAKGAFFSTVSLTSRYLTRRFQNPQDFRFAYQFLDLLNWLNERSVSLSDQEQLAASNAILMTGLQEFYTADEIRTNLSFAGSLQENNAHSFFRALAISFFGSYENALIANCPSVAATYSLSLNSENLRTPSAGYFAYHYIHGSPSYPRHPIWLKPIYSPTGESAKLVELVMSFQRQPQNPFVEIQLPNADSPWTLIQD